MQAPVDTLGDPFGNPYGGVASFSSGLRTSDLHHARFFVEEAPDGVFAEEPQSGEFSNCVVSFESERTQGRLSLDGIGDAVRWFQLEFHSAPPVIGGSVAWRE